MSAIRGQDGEIEDFEIRWTNDAWRRAVAKTVGFPADILPDPTGRRLYEVLPPSVERVDPHRRVVEDQVVYNALVWAADHWEELRFSPHGDGFVMVARDVTDRVDADNARRESAAQMSALVSLSPDAIAVLENGIVTFANEAAARLLGAERPDDLLGRPSLEYIVPERRELSAARTRHLVQTGEPVIREDQTYLRLDGSRVEVENSAVLLPSSDGVARVLLVAHDVTERRVMDAAITEANDRLTRAQRAAGAGLWEWDMTTDRLTWSPELFTLFGLDPETDEASFETWARVMHPGDVAAANARLAASIAARELLQNDYRIIRPVDGAIRWIEALGSTEEDADGVPRKMAGICLDVTDRKLAELALEESNRLMHEAQRAAGVGSYRADFVSNRWWSSPVLDEIFGIDERFDRSVPGWINLIHPDDRAPSAQYLAEEVIAKGQPFDFEYRVVRPSDGAVRWVHGLGEVTLAEDGTALSLMGTIQDVTDRRLAAEERARLGAQLQDAQRMEAIGRLAGGIAHDFNNMLGAILGYTELALGRVDQGGDLEADLLEVHRAATRSAELTRQLLAYARRDTASPRVVDVNAAVAGELKLLRRVLGETFSLEFHADPRAGHVRIDPAQLHRALANLCVNARDALDVSGGRIVVETGRVTISGDDCAGRPGRTPDDYVTLAVRDNGHGMTPEVLANVFEPFFTTKAVGEGTGLGLAMVHGIVTGAGGFVDVTSRPGAGTSFVIHLPARAEETATVEAAALAVAATPAVAAPHDTTILLVEDEPALLALTGRLLRHLGYTVITAASPAEALALCEAREHPFDLLLTDVVMPGMNGRELAELVRRYRPGVAVVFMSGYPVDHASQRGMPAGSHFIAKPFSVGALSSGVREALEAR